MTSDAAWVRPFERGETARLTASEREDILALADPVDMPEAGFIGGPVILRLRSRLAALEQAGPDAWALRPLAGEQEVRAFLERRREELDRMWDGCGCSIDYFD